MSKRKRIIRAINVQYKNGDETVDLFKGDELPADAPADFVKRLDADGGLEPLDGEAPAETPDQPPEPITGDYASHEKSALEGEAERRGLTVEGTGSGGNVLKEDLVKALEAADAGEQPPAE